VTKLIIQIYKKKSSGYKHISLLHSVSKSITMRHHCAEQVVKLFYFHHIKNTKHLSYHLWTIKIITCIQLHLRPLTLASMIFL